MVAQSVEVVPAPRRSMRAFMRWVAASCDDGTRVLDIGAGANRSGSLRPVLLKSPYLVGIDPDASVLGNTVLHERHQTSLEDFATEHPEEFDVAFAAYVLEHVADASAFMSACATVLKPGGTLFALTPNVRHYFGATTLGLARLGLSDRVLEGLKGHDAVHEHHFPPEYRLNSIRSIGRHLGAAGFTSVEYRCFDEAGRYEWYLPTGLRWFPGAYNRLAYRLGSPNLMGHLSFRAVK